MNEQTQTQTPALTYQSHLTSLSSCLTLPFQRDYTKGDNWHTYHNTDHRFRWHWFGVEDAGTDSATDSTSATPRPRHWQKLGSEPIPKWADLPWEEAEKMNAEITTRGPKASL